MWDRGKVVAQIRVYYLAQSSLGHVIVRPLDCLLGIHARPKDRVSSLIVESLAGCALPRITHIAVSSAVLECSLIEVAVRTLRYLLAL